jgi:predicted lipoprotein with Yx(FWY)xxD motif
MKRIALVLTALLITGSAAFAMDPAKTMDTAAGKMWTDDKGMTLYTFDKDDQGKSNCYDQCAKNWPPFAATADAKAEGDWTIIDRTDGSKMWAYGGKPLYTFSRDGKPGDVTGDMVGGVWHVAKPLPVKT